MALSKKIKEAVERFDDACQEMAFLGGKMPEEHGDIELEYERAHNNLKKQIKRAVRKAAKCSHDHTPNAETVAAFEESRAMAAERRGES